jgi:spermidine synthase
LVSFSGNELTIGVVLANWVISEALGVFLIGKIIDKVKSKIDVFIILQIVFSLTFPIAVYFARTFKGYLGLPFGESIGLNLIFLGSFFIILPVSFCHGALFSVCSKLYSSRIKESARVIGRVYTWEMLGTILGGTIMTYLFIPFLNSFQIALLVILVNLAACIVYFKIIADKKLKFAALAGLCFAAVLIFGRGVNYLQRNSINKQWKNMEVLDYRNSIYGNITVTKQPQQYTFFYNGLPVITTPYPDITFAEEFGNLPLLFHVAPKEILIISAGAGGLIDQILKHPVTNIDYAEIDPLIIDMLRKYPTELTQAELSDKRVHIINVDGRFLLKTQKKRYDVIMIGFSSQSDLSTNRLFTQEFFAMAEERLKPEGVIAFWLPGSLTYLSPEVRDLNSCILTALKHSFNYVRIIPGDYNIYLASPSKELMAVSAGLISQRISKNSIRTNLLIPTYLEYRFDKKWLDWFMNSLAGATRNVNRDYQPFAVFQMLLFWNNKFSPAFSFFLRALRNLNLNMSATVIFLIGLLIFYLARRRKNKRIAVSFSIATTGFFGMLATLALVFSYQVYYGYLYYRIGLLVSIFMSGVAFGSLLMTGRVEKIRNARNLFKCLEILIIFFSFAMAIIITRFLGNRSMAGAVFMGLFFASGMLMGLQFPLATKIYSQEKSGVGEVSGALYASDLIGGWVAGVIGGVILLPVLGFFNACMVMVFLKLASLTVFSLSYKKTGF